MFVIFFYIIVLIAPLQATHCKIKLNKDKVKNLPLLLKPGNQDYSDAFYLPTDAEGTISFTPKDVIHLECPGTTINIPNNPTAAIAQCVTDKKFKINNKIYEVSTIKCKGIIESQLKPTGQRCLIYYDKIDIGFQLSNRFLKQMTVCFDSVKLATLQSYTKIPYPNVGYQRYIESPNFEHDKIFPEEKTGFLAMKEVYEKQQETINNRLGLDITNTKIINLEDSTRRLTRGHLTGKTDFIFEAQQKMTFRFINTAPQWKSINEGNFKILENSIQRYIASFKGPRDFWVFTGTYGIMTHPNKKRDIPIYLASGKSTVPVPKFFWKVLYDPVFDFGYAFITFNDPKPKIVSDKDLFCPDICHNIFWLTIPDRKVKEKGYTYCCNIKTFNDTLGLLPKLPLQA